MANKDRNKRSARQARAREREALEAAQAASIPSDPKKQKALAKSKAPAAKVERTSSSNKGGKPGFFTRVKNYFHDVRVEMHRVVWPSKSELTNYSVAVIATLLVFGVAIWLVDTGFVALLVAFTGLRG